MEPQINSSQPQELQPVEKHFSKTKIAAIIVMIGLIPTIAFVIGTRYMDTLNFFQQEQEAFNEQVSIPCCMVEKTPYTGTESTSTSTSTTTVIIWSGPNQATSSNAQIQVELQGTEETTLPQ